MNGTRTTMGASAALGVALLAMLVLPGLASTASAAPVPAGSSSSQQWAYGAQKWFNTSFSTTNGTYTSTAYFGWQVIFTATNTSATTVMLEAQRTMKGSFSAQLCSPGCTNATAQGSLSISGWESDVGFANFTTTATVFESGVATPAVGISDAHTQAAGNITEALSYSFPSGGHTYSATQGLFVNGSAHAQIAFAPALGLVPYNASKGTSWNSSAGFNASGAWSINALWYRTTILGTSLSGSPSASNSVQATGNVWLAGTDLGTITLANGETVPVIVLAWTGPFDDLDGVVLVPHDWDLFGSADASYAGDELGSETVATANLDVSVDSAHHLHFAAAATAYASNDATLATQAAPTAARGPAAGPSPSVVQAQPESVAQAQQSSDCLTGHCAGTSAGLGNLLGVVVVVGLIAVVVVGAVSVVEYRRWAQKRAQQGIVSPTSPIRQAVPPPGATLGGATPPPTASSPANSPPRGPA